MNGKTISANNLASWLGVSRATIDKWITSGKIKSDANSNIALEDIRFIPEINEMFNSSWNEELNTQPLKQFTSIELFAGAGGLALGLDLAGFNHILLNEFDHDACETLKRNRPTWNVVAGDIRDVDFSPLKDKVDLLSGGFPCQAFSYAGKRLGFEETRGTLFFEMARAANEIKPKIILCENVKGLMSHDSGRTLTTIQGVLSDLGYVVIEPKILKAVHFNVPQKRERLFIVAVRNDLYPNMSFEWPSICPNIRTLRDAFHKGDLYPVDVPISEGQEYPKSKKEVMELVPEGGDWRNLPKDVAINYMKGSYHLGGGKTGMARRLSLDEPSLTLTCAPAQKQTERCHPTETRPLTVREYARIQTFPDDWCFSGNISSKYKQIGNAVPVNLAWAIGRALIRALNSIVESGVYEDINTERLHLEPYYKLHGLFDGMVCEKGVKYKTGKN